MTTATQSQTVTSPANNTIAQVVNTARLIDVLKDSRKGAKPISCVAKTEPKMRKTGNRFHGKVVKVAMINGMVNFHYDNAVLRRLEKEGKDSSEFHKGTSWHEPVMVDGKMTPLCQHKKNGTHYLRFMLINSTSELRWKDSDKELSSKELEEIKEFMPKSRYENQGLDNPVKILTYSLDSIKTLTMDKVTYIHAS